MKCDESFVHWLVIGIFVTCVACKGNEDLGPTPQLIQITQHPIGGSVCPLGQFEFTVGADCNADLHYQWEVRNSDKWTNLHQDKPYYRTAPLYSSQTYRVLVYSSDTLCIPIYSQDALVEISQDVTITASPLDTMVGVNDTFSLKVDAEGGGQLHYQWKKLEEGTFLNIGEDTSVLTVNGISQNASFLVDVFNENAGCTRRTSATANVLLSPIGDVVGKFTGYCHRVKQLYYQGNTWYEYDTIDSKEIKIHLIEIDEPYFVVDVEGFHPSPFYLRIDDINHGMAVDANYLGQWHSSLRVDFNNNNITTIQEIFTLPGYDRQTCYCAIQ